LSSLKQAHNWALKSINKLKYALYLIFNLKSLFYSIKYPPALFASPSVVVRDLRFDNVPFGRTQFAPTLSTKSVTVGAQSLRPPIDWDMILTQVPKLY